MEKLKAVMEKDNHNYVAIFEGNERRKVLTEKKFGTIEEVKRFIDMFNNKLSEDDKIRSLF